MTSENQFNQRLMLLVMKLRNGEGRRSQAVFHNRVQKVLQIVKEENFSSSRKSEVKQLRREAVILKNQLDEARKERNALLDWREKHDVELKTASRESNLFKLSMK